MMCYETIKAVKVQDGPYLNSPQKLTLISNDDTFASEELVVTSKEISFRHVSGAIVTMEMVFGGWVIRRIDDAQMPFNLFVFHIPR